MTQQVEVTVKLTLEVDATVNKQEIENFIKESVLVATDEDCLFSFNKLDIIEIKEEKDIYDNK